MKGDAETSQLHAGQGRPIAVWTRRGLFTGLLFGAVGFGVFVHLDAKNPGNPPKHGRYHVLPPAWFGLCMAVGPLAGTIMGAAQEWIERRRETLDAEAGL